MLTTGEAITAVLAIHLNPGQDVWQTDAEERARMRFLLTGVCQQIWTRCPWWFKRGTGTVALTAGVGSLPTDFGALGTQAKVYILGDTEQPLAYKVPDEFFALVNTGAGSGRPYYFTLFDVDGSGRQKIVCWPQDNSSLLVRTYDRVMPELIDSPVMPGVALLDDAGLPTGEYTYRVTFVTANGETEGGAVSDPVTADDQQIELSEIATSPARSVTGRRLWRNAAAAPGIHKLLGTISDNLTTTFTDNVADGALGATLVPTPATALYTGLEVFPASFHESLIMDGLEARALKAVGSAYDPSWIRAVKQMWSQVDPAEHQMKLMPAYGQAASLGGGGADFWRTKIPLG